MDAKSVIMIMFLALIFAVCFVAFLDYKTTKKNKKSK